MNLSILNIAALFASTAALVPSFTKKSSVVSQQAKFQPFEVQKKKLDVNALSAALLGASASIAAPLVAVAEEDNYEYGAVDAPIGLAWGAGAVLILTALLPLAMQGGEEAFEEMKSKDSDQWGSNSSDRLNKRK